MEANSQPYNSWPASPLLGLPWLALQSPSLLHTTVLGYLSSPRPPRKLGQLGANINTRTIHSNLKSKGDPVARQRPQVSPDTFCWQELHCPQALQTPNLRTSPRRQAHNLLHKGWPLFFLDLFLTVIKAPPTQAFRILRLSPELGPLGANTELQRLVPKALRVLEG